MNIANLLVRSAGVFGERPAVALGERFVLDYEDLARRSSVIAGNLRHKLGLGPGERVALVMKNVPEYVELLFACWHGGLVATPVNAKLHPQEFAYILADCAARACFVTADLADAVSSVASRLPALQRIICVGGREYGRLLDGEAIPPYPSEPTDTAWLFYTSGTTGKPKGAMLSHRNLMAMTACYRCDVDDIDAGDSIVHAAPMSHGSGLYILPHVAAGAVQVVPESGRFDPEEIFRLVARHPGSAFFAAPTMIKRLIDSPDVGAADLANLKTIVYGGGPMYLEDCKRALQVLGNRLAQIYGQGESPMTITALRKSYFADVDHPRYEARLGSVGFAQTMVQVRVADGDGAPLPAGEIGEVLVGGDAVMGGYWKNPEASRKALQGGWLHTGDVGVLDQDGFLTLKDRTKDVIISGGANIYPREIEEVLLRHESILEAAVVGRRHPDWGEEVVAFVVERGAESVTRPQLDAFCLGNIARFKRPREYRFVGALPKNSYGKILKTVLREWLEADNTA